MAEHNHYGTKVLDLGWCPACDAVHRLHDAIMATDDGDLFDAIDDLTT